MIFVENKQLIKLISELIASGGMPKNIKTSLEDSLNTLSSKDGSEEEKVAQLLFILDEASSDPNVSAHTRTRIWSVVSQMETMQRA